MRLRMTIPLLLAALLACSRPAPAAAQDADRPRVAILIYDGVQIIDHAAPWEVLGQYSLNEVYTVARDTTPVTTFMGMRVLPSYGFDDHPPPDVVVVPGGNSGDARSDPEVIEWLRRNAGAADYVLAVCSGVSILAETGLLDGRSATTFYNLLDDLAESRPAIEVVEDRIVVQDGKFVTTTGTGIEGALRISELLHGEPWTRVVALNLEFESVPSSERTPRAWLADMNLPSSIYGIIPWRAAELSAYEGDASRWRMTWRFPAQELEPLAAELSAGLSGEGWARRAEEGETDGWTATWSLEGRGGDTWSGETRLAPLPGGRLEFDIVVNDDAGGPPP